MNKRGRPSKPENEAQKEVLQVRLLPQVKRVFEKAAKQSGLPLSAWARSKLMEVARKELESSGHKVDYDL